MNAEALPRDPSSPSASTQLDLSRRSAAKADESWTARRWIGLAMIIFAAQIGAFFLLGKTPPPEKKSFRPAPVLIAVSTTPEITALENPTLFALPNQHGFSGAAWLKVEFAKYAPPDWTEPESWLDLRLDELGTAFRRLIPSNQSPAQIAQKIDPEYALPRPSSPDEESNSHSTFRVDGELASRPLLSHFDLRSWTNATPLTNTVVQLIINSAGFTRTATLLASSGYKEADDEALALSKAARFQPLLFSEAKNNPGKLTLGQIVFEWQTMPLSLTNKF